MVALQAQFTSLGVLPAAQREALLDEMFALDRAVFPTASPDDLKHFLHDPRARDVAVVLYRDDGRLVGQNIIPILDVQLAHGRSAIFTSVAGILPEYRGGRRTVADAFRVVWRWRMRHPLTPAYMVVAPMQARAYEQFVDLSERVYPRHDRPTPAALAAVLDVVGEGDATMVKRRSQWVQTGSPVPKMTHREASVLSRSTGHRRYFRSFVDPGAGEGLVIVAPLDGAQVVSCVARIAVRRLQARRP